MNNNMLIVLAAAGGFLALPVALAGTAPAEDPAAAEVQEDAIHVTTVLIKGGG